MTAIAESRKISIVRMLWAYTDTCDSDNVLETLQLTDICCCCRNGSSSSSALSEESGAEHRADSEELDDAADDSDADDFQQTSKPRSNKSAYDIDILDSEQESENDSPGAKRKGTCRSSRGKTAKSDTALPARRQPTRTAAAKVSLAESPSESSEADSQQSAEEEEQEASDGNQEGSRSKKRIGRDHKVGKAGAKRQKALVAEDDSDDSMAEAKGVVAVVISDSEAQADEESDKENQPTRLLPDPCNVDRGCTPCRKSHDVLCCMYPLQGLM